MELALRLASVPHTGWLCYLRDLYRRKQLARLFKRAHWAGQNCSSGKKSKESNLRHTLWLSSHDKSRHRHAAAFSADNDDAGMSHVPSARPVGIKIVADRKSTRLNSSHLGISY